MIIVLFLLWNTLGYAEKTTQSIIKKKLSLFGFIWVEGLLKSIASLVVFIILLNWLGHLLSQLLL